VDSAPRAAMPEVAEGWQDWIVKMNRPTIDEIICAHLPDGSVPPKWPVPNRTRIRRVLGRNPRSSPPQIPHSPLHQSPTRNAGSPIPPPPGSSPRPAFPA
jgi:hypothetical protein